MIPEYCYPNDSSHSVLPGFLGSFSLFTRLKQDLGGNPSVGDISSFIYIHPMCTLHLGLVQPLRCFIFTSSSVLNFVELK